MTMTLHRSGSVLRASLSGDLTVLQVSSLHRQFLAEVDSEGTLVIEATGVTRLDTSVAQLFLFASQFFSAVRVESPSPAWESAMITLGLCLDSAGP